MSPLNHLLVLYKNKHFTNVTATKQLENVYIYIFIFLYILYIYFFKVVCIVPFSVELLESILYLHGVYI